MQRPSNREVDNGLEELLRRFGPSGFLVNDFETKSFLDVPDVGPTVYAMHPSTDVWCMSYKLIHPTKGAMKTGIWLNGEPIPSHVKYALDNKLPIYAHNVWFERNIWRYVMVEKHGWPDVDFMQWRCIAAQANACAMPRALFSLCEALDLPIKKDLQGHKLMMRVKSPRKPTAADKDAYIESIFGEGIYSKKELRSMSKDPSLLKGMPVLWHDSPQDLERLGQYCITDTDAEFGAMVAMPDMTEKEVEIWRLDQRINLRGVPCDVDAVKAALDCLGRMAIDSKAAIEDLTWGLVTTPDQTEKIKEFCSIMGVDIPNTQADTVEAFLRQDIPIEVRRVLEIRQLMAKASTKKYMSMWDRLKHGHSRLFGLLIYMGAQKTGRWSSGGVQLHNMSRGVIKHQAIIEFCIKCILSRNLDLLKELYDVVTDVFASVTRSMICTTEDNVFMCADFSAIEARVAFWLAGQKDALEIIRATDLDPESNPDIYRINAGSIYAKDPWSIVDSERQTGKMSILGFQYGMGEEAFQMQSLEIWGVWLELEFCKLMKEDYRSKYPEVVGTWKAYDRAVKKAISHRTKVRVGNVVFECRGIFLYVHLPSGRSLHYFKPGLKMETVKNKDGTSWESQSIRYWGRESKSKQWRKLYMYGAKFFQHIVQALARDIMAEAMLRVDSTYPVVLTVHDEILSEVKKTLVELDVLSLDDFIYLMSQKSEWVGDCPIKADGWSGRRFRK